nr:hypothetical protein [Verrucomicrobium spinosum]
MRGQVGIQFVGALDVLRYQARYAIAEKNEVGGGGPGLVPPGAHDLGVILKNARMGKLLCHDLLPKSHVGESAGDVSEMEGKLPCPVGDVAQADAKVVAVQYHLVRGAALSNLQVTAVNGIEDRDFPSVILAAHLKFGQPLGGPGKIDDECRESHRGGPFLFRHCRRRLFAADQL